MKTLKELRKNLQEILKNKEDCNFEADLIISHITKLAKYKWLFKKFISEKKFKKCINIAKKREKGLPIQYILKNWEFYGIPIKVKKGVLIPRQDTETLVEVALKLIKQNDIIVELGSGSGAISAAIAKNKKNVKIFAIEKYIKAYFCSRYNLKTFKKNVKLIRGDMLNENLAKKFKDIDFIVSNPPYIDYEDMTKIEKELKYEPKKALYGGKDGLNYYRKISYIWKNSLKENAKIIFEIGYNQKDSVFNILKQNGFKNIQIYKDLTKKYRVIVGQK